MSDSEGSNAGGMLFQRGAEEGAMWDDSELIRAWYKQVEYDPNDAESSESSDSGSSQAVGSSSGSERGPSPQNDASKGRGRKRNRSASNGGEQVGTGAIQRGNNQVAMAPPPAGGPMAPLPLPAAVQADPLLYNMVHAWYQAGYWSGYYAEVAAQRDSGTAEESGRRRRTRK